MSASSRAEDIQRAYDLGANSYLVKPGNLDGLMHLAKCLVGWLKLSHFAPVIEANESGSPFPFNGADIHLEHAGHPLVR